MTLATLSLAAAAVFAAPAAQAAQFDFSGHIAFHNDVVRISFSLLSDATDVRVWTDSYGGTSPNGINFDPITAVWNLSEGGKLVGEDDDNGDIAPGQNNYDSGLVFDELKAGDYMFTIAAYPNWRKGDTLGEGFQYDGEAPIPLAQWDQPQSHLGMGTYWSVHLSGVDAATPPVPEPQTYALMLCGLLAMGFVARRRSGN